jgi:UrcA family protein
MNTLEHVRRLGHLALLAGLCTAAPLYSGTVAAGTITRSVIVRYGDLDLQRDAGVRALYARLRAASRQVCGPEPSGPGLRDRGYERCRRQALDHAVFDSGSLALALLHRSTTDASGPARVARATSSPNRVAE